MTKYWADVGSLSLVLRSNTESISPKHSLGTEVCKFVDGLHGAQSTSCAVSATSVQSKVPPPHTPNIFLVSSSVSLAPSSGILGRHQSWVGVTTNRVCLVNLQRLSLVQLLRYQFHFLDELRLRFGVTELVTAALVPTIFGTKLR